METPFDYNSKPTTEMIDRMELFRKKYIELFNMIGDHAEGLTGRERSVAFTKLEESAMWLNKSISHSEIGKAKTPLRHG